MSFWGRRSSKPEQQTQNHYESASFSSKRCASFFNDYASQSDPEVIDPDGLIRLFRDLDIRHDDPVTLVLAYKMDAKQVGYFTRKEWNKGLQDMQCDSLSKLKARIPDLRSYLSDPNSFKNIYRFVFDFSKDKDQRSLDMETARVLMDLLLRGVNKWALFPYFNAFLEESKYKVINKDQWCNVLEFSKSVSHDLKNYDEDGAWPVLLDEFVDWFRKKQAAHAKAAGIEESDVIQID